MCMYTIIVTCVTGLLLVSVAWLLIPVHCAPGIQEQVKLCSSCSMPCHVSAHLAANHDGIWQTEDGSMAFVSLIHIMWSCVSTLSPKSKYRPVVTS
jgi:hypothetical protein